MDTSTQRGRNEGGITPEAADLMRQMHAGQRPAASSPALDELVQAELATYDPHSGVFIATDLASAARIVTRTATAEIASSIARAEQLSALVAELSSMPQPDSGGVLRIDHYEEVTALMAEAVRGAAFVRTAHPIPRPAGRLAGGFERDAEVVRRGSELHVIYLETARTRAPEQDYARKISAIGAKVRTLNPPFERMVLTPTAAFISDTTGDQAGKPALRVTNPGLLAFISSVYDQQWQAARPWMGEAPTRSDGVTERHHFVMRRLLDGRVLKAVALELGVSVSTLYGDLDRLQALSGVSGHFALGAWYAATYGDGGKGELAA
ncbi:hypothetical protein [Streptomyces sp. NBC_00102]|uniref:hypothetical protein n=1 Tax=Streptomyces sp. NBC_00102 TaxID=2975652 RepID=UPI0022507C08|nr:hypothetical protein [Streptomyces sp. NBC_00102]MCX5398486.1 hypothetical protein [Streptomyces sp. NBC_00102]